MHTIFFKENEGIFADPNITGSQPAQVPLWGVMGSQPSPPPPPHDNQFLQLAVAKESDQVLAKKDTTHFTVFPGDCRTAENGAKTTYQEQLKLGFGQPQICVQYPYNAEQCYGSNSAYGPQIEGQRIMLPLSMASDGGLILVNAKQYHGIMRRRRLRAKAESKNQEMKIRKPYMHVSRHLHAVRRQRGSSGRFLSTKSSNTNTNTMSDEKKKGGKRENHQQPQSTESQMSEVLQCDGRIHSTKTNSSSNSTSPGSEVTSFLHHFEFDRLLQPSFHPFLDVGIADKYLKV